MARCPGEGNDSMATPQKYGGRLGLNMLNFIIYGLGLDNACFSEDLIEPIERGLGKSEHYGFQPSTILQEHTWHKGHGPDAEHRKCLPL